MSGRNDLQAARIRRPVGTAAGLVRPAWRRATSWVAVALLAVALAMILFAAATIILPGFAQLPNRPSSLPEVVFIVVAMLAIGSLAVVGTTLAILRPGNPIGWLLLVSGLAIILGNTGPQYVSWSIDLGANLPGVLVVDWFGSRSEAIGFTLLAVWVPLLFPEGRLPGPRWRAVAWLAAITMATSIAAGAVIEPGGEWGPQLPNPLAIDGPIGNVATFWASASTVLIAALLVLTALSVIVRFRRSRGMEREQLKWFLAAAGVVTVTLVAMAITQQDWLYSLSFAAFGLVPVAIGIAVLRLRLYEIDRLISRTIGWAIVTATLVGAFALLVLGLSSVLEPLTGGNTLAIAASTLVVAALFAPLRSRVQGAVDRRFDRSRYDGERLLAAFGERLRDEVDLTTISADVLATVDAAVRPATAGLWLRERPEGGV